MQLHHWEMEKFWFLGMGMSDMQLICCILIFISYQARRVERSQGQGQEWLWICSSQKQHSQLENERATDSEIIIQSEDDSEVSQYMLHGFPFSRINLWKK